MTRAQRFTSAAAVLLAVGILAIGCSNSSRNPLDSPATAGSSSFALGNQRIIASPTDFEIGGRVATIDPAARTMTLDNSDIMITVAKSAEIELNLDGGSNSTIPLDSIMVGDSVEVRGEHSGNTMTADRVRVRERGNHDDDGNGQGENENEVEFRGVITAIDPSAGTFTVDSRSETITTDSLTRFFAHVSRGESSTTLSDGHDDLEGKQEISFADLKTGDTVEVEGSSVDSFTVHAALVKVENNELNDDSGGQPAETEFKAMISSIDYGTRTVTFFDSPDTVVVASDAQLFGFQGETVDLTFFGICFIVEVRGFRAADGQLTVNRMKPDNTL